MPPENYVARERARVDSAFRNFLVDLLADVAEWVEQDRRSKAAWN